MTYSRARKNALIYHRPIPLYGKSTKHIPDINLMLSFHVETVVLLSQQKPNDRIEIDLDLDELDPTPAESKATYEEIKDYILQTFKLKVSNLYISQVKRKYGLEVGQNYNLSKSDNPKIPQCPPDKEKAIKKALMVIG